MTAKTREITRWLQQWSTGDAEAAERVLPLVYEELRRIAAGQLRRERRSGHTLQATAIVNEAYLRLAGQEGLRWPSRTQFFAFASHLIRRILVDHARTRLAARRGGQMQRITLAEIEELAGPAPGPNPDLLALDEALTALEALDTRKALIVELRYFAGLSVEETAAHLGVSVETVGREWRRARAWLFNELAPRKEG